MKDILELEIIDLTNEGKGVAKHEQLTYFVDGAQIGQKVLAEVTDYKKNYCQAKTIRAIEETPYSQKPLCIYTNICDGCIFQDIIYEKQKSLKKSNIINSVNRIAREQLKDMPFEEGPSRYYYRNKVELKVSPFGHLSYFSRKTNDHVAIKECIIANEQINQIIELLQAQIYSQEIRGYDARRNVGFLKNITIRATDYGQSMVILVLNEEKNLQDFYDNLKAASLIDSLYVCVNSKKNNYKITKPRLVFGLEKITEIMGERKFLISPKSFFQVNTKQAFNIYSDVKNLINEIKPSLLIDLYSGISTTSIILSDSVDKIISVELVADAVKDARENASLNHVSNIEFLQGDAGQIINKLDLSKGNSMLLVDPPRKGLDPNIIVKIGQSDIKHIAYISCNPSTLARDIKEFKNYGFKLEKIKGYDMFVNTLHVETVALLSKLDVDKHISVEIELDELDLTSAESKATYAQIKEYVWNKFQLKVPTLYIAQIKRKCGIELREHYNKSKKEKQIIPRCTPEKEEAIMDALRHFKMIE